MDETTKRRLIKLLDKMSEHMEKFERDLEALDPDTDLSDTWNAFDQLSDALAADSARLEF